MPCRAGENLMQPWQIGVFASVDAGLGVHLDVAQELGIPTVQVHAPHQATRTQAAADDFLRRTRAAGITVTCVFGGFDGESYADIPTVQQTVGFIPPKTREAREWRTLAVSDFGRTRPSILRGGDDEDQ